MRKIKELIQAILAIPAIKTLLRWFSLIVTGLFSSNRLFSVVYHLFCFFPHSREQQAVLRGQYRYFRNEYLGQDTKVNLRRNIHRLEKGLLMRPRKAVFGLNFIADTVRYFGIQVGSANVDDHPEALDELYWASDVLHAYFDAVEKRPILKRLQADFEEIQIRLPKRKLGDRKRIPYRPERGTPPSVTYRDLLELSRRRKSVRWFKDRPVPRELLDQAVSIASETPSACNRQPFHYRIYDDRSLVQKVAAFPFGSAGYADNIPAIVVLTGDLSYYFSSRDRHIIYIDASLSAMAFIYGLETLGLGSCVINWPDFEPLEMKISKTLGLKLEERPIMMIAVGYPDAEGEVAYSQRKPIDQVRSYNRID